MPFPLTLLTYHSFTPSVCLYSSMSLCLLQSFSSSGHTRSCSPGFQNKGKSSLFLIYLPKSYREAIMKEVTWSPDKPIKSPLRTEAWVLCCYLVDRSYKQDHGGVARLQTSLNVPFWFNAWNVLVTETSKVSSCIRLCFKGKARGILVLSIKCFSQTCIVFSSLFSFAGRQSAASITDWFEN